jgi:hypothetical protein
MFLVDVGRGSSFPPAVKDLLLFPTGLRTTPQGLVPSGASPKVCKEEEAEEVELDDFIADGFTGSISPCGAERSSSVTEGKTRGADAE